MDSDHENEKEVEKELSAAYQEWSCSDALFESSQPVNVFEYVLYT